MADQNKPQDDLSIEEILGSIRRIIAEDDEETAAPAEEAQDEIVQQKAEEDDVEEEPLELTNKIEPDGSITDTSVPDEISMSDAADDFVMQDSEPLEPIRRNPEPEYQEKIILVEEPMAMQEEDNFSSEALLSSATAEATTAVMAKLARHTALLQDGAQAGAYGPTVESIVRELLRPMLKTWLDDNLPGMVQKMVEREIERLTKSL